MNNIIIIISAIVNVHLDLVKADVETNFNNTDYRKTFQKYNHRIHDSGLRLFTTTIVTHSPILKHIDHFNNLGHFDDADVRGPDWYNFDASKSIASDSEADDDKEQDITLSSSSLEEKKNEHHDEQRHTSSVETNEESRNHQRYRVCHPCPEDMIKKYTNLGIKWICGGYHQARRSFKSACMMRFRNCQDGTMFQKLYDRRCKDDGFHGKHFFYQYPV